MNTTTPEPPEPKPRLTRRSRPEVLAREFLHQVMPAEAKPAWRPWTVEDVEVHRNATALRMLIPGDMRAPGIVGWLNLVAEKLLERLWNTTRLRRRVGPIRNPALAYWSTWMTDHTSTFIDELVHVIDEGFVAAAIEPGGRLDLTPGVNAQEILRAADLLEEAVGLLRRNGARARQVETLRARILYETRTLLYGKYRGEQTTAGRRSRRGNYDFALVWGRVYQALVSGRARPLVGSPDDLLPRCRVLTRCTVCRVRGPLTHDLFGTKDVKPLLADLMTRLLIRPNLKAAKPGDPWSERAAQDVIDQFLSRHLPRHTRV